MINDSTTRPERSPAKRLVRPFAVAAVLGAALVAAACTPPSTPNPNPTTSAPTTAAPTTVPAGPRVTVSKVTGLGASQNLVITGTGFNPNSNNGFGIYVSFGRAAVLGTSNAADLAATKWVHKNFVGSTETSGQAKLNANGTFSITLPVTKVFTDTTGTVTCATQCAIMTMAAHGVADRSQDTSTALRFN